MTMMAAFAAVIAAVTAVNVLEIFFVRDTLGGSATMYGLVAATWTLGVLIGAWPWGRARGGDRSLVHEGPPAGPASLARIAAAWSPADFQSIPAPC